MASAPYPATETQAPPPAGRGTGRLLSRIVVAIVLLSAVLLGAVRWLDTESGHAFLLRQLPRLQLQSGLTVRAGRIDGSIFGKAVIHDLRLGDPEGIFLAAPAIAIDWRPIDLASNRLTIFDAHAGEIQMLRMPRLRPTGDDRILPDYDIVIDRLVIDRLVLAPALAGTQRVLGINGKADIRAGRALIKLAAQTIAGATAAGGDQVVLNLDAEPDRDRFDIGAEIAAPADGAIVRMLGIEQALAVTLGGDGSWTKWHGTLAAMLGGTPLADLKLSAAAGQFAMSGTAMPARLLKGAAGRLAGPQLAIDATATVAGRRADVAARLASAALALDARGGLDFADESIRGFTIDARLLDARAIAARLSGNDIRLAVRVAGSFKAPLVDYRLHAASAAWGTTVAQDLSVNGIVRAGERPLVIPATATALRLTGVGETAAPLLTQVRVAGPLTFAGGKVSAAKLDFRTARLSGTASLVAVLGEDDYRVDAKASLPGYFVEGLGLTNIDAAVRVSPGVGGAQVAGTTAIAVTRLDNGFFRRLTGGLPMITADIGLDSALALAFRNARLQSPALALTAAGTRSPAGLVMLSGSGVSRDYGPLTLRLAGPIAAPVVDLVLARPGLGLGLAAVRAHIEPAAASASAGGWRFEVTGDSSYGDAAAKGVIRSDLAPLAIEIAQASIAGLNGHGRIVQTAAGPFAGRIDVTGKGLSGTTVLAAAGAVQRADIFATAKQAELALATPVTIETGMLRLALLLPNSGAAATGNFALAGVERDGLRIDQTSGSVSFANGRGSAKASATGSTDIPFVLALDAALAPDRLAVSLSGTVDSRAIRLSGPAVFNRTDAGWRLAPFSLITPEGSAEFSGLFGDRKALKANLDKVSLALLTIAFPNLDFSGQISGTLDLALAPGDVPSGTANLRLNGLSRAGIASASTPIDVGINALLSASGTVAKAVIVRGGKVEGRAQLRVGPVPAGTGRLVDRLYASPVFGQLRYTGPAQAVWGLSGFEALDVRGAVAVAVDMGGVLGDPRLTGTLGTQGARLESTLVGAVIDETTLAARFTGSRLELTSFSGRVGKGGTISGTGGIDLSAERGFPIDIRLDVKNAQLLNRDDYQAAVTGRIRIATDIYGGVVSGKLNVDRATLRIGRQTAADVPVLAVTEINSKALGRRAVSYAKPQRWLLNLDVDADRRLFVTGMGVNSEWRARGKIKGGARTPELIGTVELVRGDYDFAGKRFELTQGSLRFQGGYPPDPTINVTAATTTSGFTAQLNITGSAGRPDIKFSSVPSLPEDEVLSRVLFGDSVTNLSAPEAVQLAGALASLRGGSGVLNPINLVRKGLGIDRLRILPADVTLGRKTAVAAGQYIGRNLYVELATDAQGYTATNIEVSLTRSLSILSQVATLGGTSVSVRLKKDY